MSIPCGMIWNILNEKAEALSLLLLINDPFCTASPFLKVRAALSSGSLGVKPEVNLKLGRREDDAKAKRCKRNPNSIPNKYSCIAKNKWHFNVLLPAFAAFASAKESPASAA